MIHQVVSEMWVFGMGSTISEHPVHTVTVNDLLAAEVQTITEDFL